MKQALRKNKDVAMLGPAGAISPAEITANPPFVFKGPFPLPACPQHTMVWQHHEDWGTSPGGDQLGWTSGVQSVAFPGNEISFGHSHYYFLINQSLICLSPL